MKFCNILDGRRHPTENYLYCNNFEKVIPNNGLNLAGIIRVLKFEIRDYHRQQFLKIKKTNIRGVQSLLILLEFLLQQQNSNVKNN